MVSLLPAVATVGGLVVLPQLSGLALVIAGGRRARRAADPPPVPRRDRPSPLGLRLGLRTPNGDFTIEVDPAGTTFHAGHAQMYRIGASALLPGLADAVLIRLARALRARAIYTFDYERHIERQRGPMSSPTLVHGA